MKINFMHEWELEQLSLPIETYEWWYQALSTDDVATVTRSLAEAQQEKVVSLLYGKFRFCQDEDYVASTIKYPLEVAVCSASSRVLAELLKFPLYHPSKRSKHRNVIHSLILLAHDVPDKELSLVECYKTLCGLLNVNQLSELLHMENETGLKPLELAAKLTTLDLTTAILQTRGVYLIEEKRSGLLLQQWYDVSDYETLSGKPAPRQMMSPVGMISFMTKTNISCKSTARFFSWKAIQNWCAFKKKLNQIPVLLMLTFRLTHICAFYAFDYYIASYKYYYNTLMFNQTHNTTAINNTTNNACTVGLVTSRKDILGILYYILTCSILVIFHDVVETICWLVNKKTRQIFCLIFRSDLAINWRLFRVSQFMMAMFMGIGSLLTYMGKDMVQGEGDTLRQVSDAIRLLAVLTTIWSILFFIQGMPYIGYFVFTIHHMLIDMINFIIVFLCFLLPFSHMFMVTIKANLQADCPQEVAWYPDAIYNTFTSMLNMVDYRKYGLKIEETIEAIHMVYVFMVAILLLNLLIAVFSNSVAEVMQYKQTYVMLETFCCNYFVDSRFAYFCPWMKKFLLKVCIKHNLVTLNGKVCLKHTDIDF